MAPTGTARVVAAGPWGVRVGAELVRALMRELGLVACQPRPWRPSTTRQGQPVTSVSAWEQGVLALNWTSQPSPVTFRDLEQVLAGALPPGSRFRLPDRLYDLFARRFRRMRGNAARSRPRSAGIRMIMQDPT
jgi:hypothetical protein